MGLFCGRWCTAYEAKTLILPFVNQNETIKMGFFSSIFGNHEVSEANKFDTLCDDGVRAMQMGELPYAEKCLKAALELQHDLKAVGFLAEVYLRMRKLHEALPLLREIHEADAENVDVALLLAQTYGELGDYAAERVISNEVIERQADEARALYLAAEADHGLADEFQAIAHLTQCLQLRPDYHAAQLLRAQVLAGMGQWAEVLADADELVKEDNENEEYLTLRAQALAAQGRTDEAAADLNGVLTLNPFNQDAVLKLGSLYEQTSRWDKALALYDEAIELQPDFAAAYKARGGVKHHLKDEAGAAEDLKHSLELAPEKAADLDGEYTNVENEMNARLRNMNPFGF